LTATLLLVLAAVAHAERPNIIFILTDDMGYGDVGCYGGKFVLTPNIDRLASEGIRFTQFSVASPICSPSRTGATTGMFPARWQITSYLQTRAGNRACEQADFLDAKAPSVARTLKAAGYATGHFGKWHMGGGRDVTNAPPITAYGFDEYASTWESPDPHPDITATNWIWSPHDKVKRWDRTAFFVDKALDFLRRHKERPCYVNVWPDDVHTPWVPADDAPKGDRPENFRRVLAEYDRQVGRLMAGLKELGIDDKTLVVFTSDNGPLPTFRGERAGGLRGSKLSLYEGGVREPFIVRWPGHAPAGQVDEQSVLNAVDLFPSFCAVAGVGVPPALDGEDVSAAWLGKPVSRAKPLFWEYGRNEKAFKYPEGRDRSPNVAVRDGQWKLLVNADGTGAELYDLAADPKETANLATRHPEIARRLTEQALRWRKALPQTHLTTGRPGETVKLPAGTFTINEPITLASGARLIGAGQDKTVVHFAGTKLGAMINLKDCEDVEVAHLTLDAQNNPNVSAGVLAGNARRLKLHHLTVRNLSKGKSFGPHGILFTGVNPTHERGVTDSEISDCLVENIAPDAKFGSGIRLAWGSSSNRVLRNIVRTTGRGGIFGDSGSTDLVIRGNTVTGSGGEGLGIEVWGRCDRAVIEDNRIDHWLSIGGSDYCAVRRNVVSDKSGTVKFCGIEGIGAHCVYTDNVVDDGQQIGISVSDKQPKDYAYWGYNTVVNCIQWAAQFQGETSGIARHYFYRCRFNRAAPIHGTPIYPHDAGHGFRTNGNVRDCVFEECEFSENDRDGIQFGGTGLDAFSFCRCVVRNNRGPAMVGLQHYTTLEWNECVVESNQTNQVRPPKPFPNPAPVAAFDAPAKARVGEPVRFVSVSRGIAAVLWDFGDGPPSSAAEATHTYTQPGDYRVTLIAWDATGRGARAEKQIRIRNKTGT